MNIFHVVRFHKNSKICTSFSFEIFMRNRFTLIFKCLSCSTISQMLQNMNQFCTGHLLWKKSLSLESPIQTRKQIIAFSWQTWWIRVARKKIVLKFIQFCVSFYGGMRHCVVLVKEFYFFAMYAAFCSWFVC